MTKLKQTSLLSLLPVEHTIGTESLPDTYALRPSLVKIVITKIQQESETTKFYIPVQWTPAEAGHLIPKIRGISWQLNEEGVPLNYKGIIHICEEFCRQSQIRD